MGADLGHDANNMVGELIIDQIKGKTMEQFNEFLKKQDIELVYDKDGVPKYAWITIKIGNKDYIIDQKEMTMTCVWHRSEDWDEKGSSDLFYHRRDEYTGKPMTNGALHEAIRDWMGTVKSRGGIW